MYKQNREVFEQRPVGHTDDDISFFEGMPDMGAIFEKSYGEGPEQSNSCLDAPVLVIEANGHMFYADFWKVDL